MPCFFVPVFAGAPFGRWNVTKHDWRILTLHIHVGKRWLKEGRLLENQRPNPREKRSSWSVKTASPRLPTSHVGNAFGWHGTVLCPKDAWNQRGCSPKNWIRGSLSFSWKLQTEAWVQFDLSWDNDKTNNLKWLAEFLPWTVSPKFKKTSYPPIAPLPSHQKNTQRGTNPPVCKDMFGFHVQPCYIMSLRGTCQNIIYIIYDYYMIIMWNMWWENHIQTSKQPVQKTLKSTVPIFVSHPCSRLVKSTHLPNKNQRLTKGHSQKIRGSGFGADPHHVSRWLDSCKESIFDKHPWGWFHGCYVVCHSTLDFKRDMVDEELCWNCMGVRFWKSLWKIWGPRHFFDGQTGSFEKSYNQVNHTGIIHRNHPRSLECIANLSLPCGGVHCFLVGLPLFKVTSLGQGWNCSPRWTQTLGLMEVMVRCSSCQ